MHIVIGIYHPAHFHFFKNAIVEMKALGHNVTVLARNKDVTIQLLEMSEIDYIKIGGHSSSIFGKLSNWGKMQSNINNILSKKENPNLVMGIGDMYLGLYGFLNQIPSVIFSDDDIITINTILTAIFANKLFTPENCRINYSKYNITNHEKYRGFHELSYLHPDNYKPDESFFDKAKIDSKKGYVVIRLVSWSAAHDLNQSGFSLKDLKHLISLILNNGKNVYLSSEKSLPDEFNQYQLSLSPNMMHDLLYNSCLLISDSQTMSTEAAILGTPVIRSNSFVGKNDISNFVELEKDYGLIFNLKKLDNVMRLTNFLLKNSDKINKLWNKRKNLMIDGKIDVNNFVISFLLNFKGKNEVK